MLNLLPILLPDFALSALPAVPAPALLAGWYVCASLACCIAYARDKRAAITGRRRTPERTLLLLGLVGGWPGALLAQNIVRHKSAKTSFQVKFWITVALHVAAVATLRAL